MAFNRVLQAGNMITNPQMKMSWVSLTTKLATRLAQHQPVEWDSFEEEASTKIVTFVLEDPRTRLEFGLRWFHELYFSDSTLPENAQRYEHNLLLLLNKLKVKDDSFDKVIGRLLMDAPALTPGVFEFIMNSATVAEGRPQLGFALLKDLILQRPPYRKECLDILFAAAIHETKGIRALGVGLCVLLHQEPDVADSIENHSLELLSKLEQSSPLGDNSEMAETDAAKDTPAEKLLPENSGLMDIEAPGEKEAPEAQESDPASQSKWTEVTVTRYTDLYFALCKGKPEMLNE